MTVDIATAAWDISYFAIKYNKLANLLINSDLLRQGDTMESEAISITYESQETSGFTFSLTDKASGDTRNVSLGLKYWRSFLMQDQWLT